VQQQRARCLVHNPCAAACSLPLLQAKALCHGVPNLEAVETVDSAKLATLLNAAWASLDPPPGRRLDVFVQVNTSGEETKYGVEPSDAPALARHVASSCPSLRLAGLMTIGQPDYSSRPENFTALVACRDAVCAELGCERGELELSMGMSGDYEAALAMGSSNVRVGSSIFGARDYGAKAA